MRNHRRGTARAPTRAVHARRSATRGAKHFLQRAPGQAGREADGSSPASRGTCGAGTRPYPPGERPALPREEHRPCLVRDHLLVMTTTQRGGRAYAFPISSEQPWSQPQPGMTISHLPEGYASRHSQCAHRARSVKEESSASRARTSDCRAACAGEKRTNRPLVRARPTPAPCLRRFPHASRATCGDATVRGYRFPPFPYPCAEIPA